MGCGSFAEFAKQLFVESPDPHLVRVGEVLGLQHQAMDSAELMVFQVLEECEGAVSYGKAQNGVARLAGLHNADAGGVKAGDAIWRLLGFAQSFQQVRAVVAVGVFDPGVGVQFVDDANPPCAFDPLANAEEVGQGDGRGVAVGGFGLGRWRWR